MSKTAEPRKSRKPAKGSKPARRAPARAKAARALRGPGVGKGFQLEGSWAVLCVKPEQFTSAVASSAPSLSGVRTELPIGTRLILRDRSGQLGVCRVKACGAQGVVLSQVWLPDPSYRLNDGQYHPREVRWVHRPNLPPKALRIVDRL